MATDYVLDAIKMRRDELKRKLAARENAGSAYAENVAELRVAIAQIEAEIATREGGAT